MNIPAKLNWGEWALRVAVAFEFGGHGIEALRIKEEWIPFFTVFGVSPETARDLMPVVGVVDLALAASVLVRPLVPLLAWMAFWGFFTALLRPLSGLSFVEFIERGANWGAPLALLLMVRARRAAVAQAPPISDSRRLD
ncbi:MAG: hypothetical protein HYY84_15380 [Deltaproteobacteria bacterium]|nr:hypothetical protein [Deltaproteobacteria bacterium]